MLLCERRVAPDQGRADWALRPRAGDISGAEHFGLHARKAIALERSRGAEGGAFIDEAGTIEIGYAVVESQWNRGYATAAVDALVMNAREAPDVRRIVAHTPLERPQSGRVLEKAGFALVQEIVVDRATT